MSRPDMARVGISMTGEGGRDPKHVLEELNAIMDDLVEKMGVWEERLRRRIEEGDEKGLIAEAGKGGFFGRKVDEVRSTLDENRPIGAQEAQVDAEKRPPQEDLDDLEVQIEDKCDTVSKKVDALMDEIMNIKEELSDRIKRSMDEMADLDIYPDGDGNLDEDLDEDLDEGRDERT
jgi:hypothetical protein